MVGIDYPNKIGPVKRKTWCDKHGRQPLTATNGDWTIHEVCLECYIELLERDLVAKIRERQRGGVTWYYHPNHPFWFDHKPYGWDDDKEMT